jgi:hypothetical protein
MFEDTRGITRSGKINESRTSNKMTNRKRTIRQTIIHKILNRKRKIEYYSRPY